MKYHARVGTPHHLEDKTYTTPGQAKKHLMTRLADRIDWAGRFNNALKRDLLTIREEINEVNVPTLPDGQTRTWIAADDYTGVEFVFQLEKEMG